MRNTPAHASTQQHDEGSGLTEFAIVAPLFVILIFWSQFFSDLGVLKLKVEEASRFALWEMTAQRDRAQVEADLRARFTDLASPVQRQYARPTGVRSYDAVTVTAVTIEDQRPAPFGGRIGGPPSSGGLLGRIIDAVRNFANKAVNALLPRLGFAPEGEAAATVRFEVRNNLFPGGIDGVGNFVFSDGGIPSQYLRVPVESRSPVMLVNTWKAWPGKYAVSNRNVNANPADTYPTTRGDSPPEREVAARMGDGRSRGAAFYLVPGWLKNPVNRVLQFIGMPGVFQSGTWRQNHGPIAMFPGERPRNPSTPGYNSHVQRVGDEYWDTNSGYRRPDSPDPGVDRSRYTVPSRINTGWWTRRGGFGSPTRTPFATTNAYTRSYACRDAFYMGSRQGALPRWNNASWASRAYPGCR